MTNGDKEVHASEKIDNVSQITPQPVVTNINNQWTKMVGKVRKRGSVKMQTKN